MGWVRGVAIALQKEPYIMWGRKDKKDKKGERRKGGGSKGGAGLPFMGLGAPLGADESEEALEAELLALQGKSPGKGKGKSPKVMSMKDIDNVVAGLDGMGEEEEEEDDEDEGGDEDDDDLLAELQEIAAGGSEEEEEEAPPTKQATNTAPKTARSSPDVTVISERLAMYDNAVQEAKSKGESTKVRRYTRAMEIIKTLQKKAQSGKAVNLDDLPPPVSSRGGGGEPQPATTGLPPTQKAEQEEISDEDLMAWAGHGPFEAPPPQPKPRPLKPQQAPPPRPKPAPPTTSDGRIDLDAPEFDEFNLSDEDMAMLAAQMGTFKSSGQQSAPRSSPPQPKPRSQAPPPQPKPRPPAPPTTSDGRIDLDAPEFDEFNLSDEDMAMLAAKMEDTTKKQKLDSGQGRTRGVKVTPPPASSLPATLSSSEPPTKDNVCSVLTERKEQYTSAMRQAKAQKNVGKAQEFGKMAARFSKVLRALEQGQEVDLSQVPPPPPGYRSKFNFDLSRYQPPITQAPQPSVVAMETPQGAVEMKEEVSNVDSSIPVPKTVMEALEQRLAKYKETQRQAQEKGESSRQRRMGRIVKQYEEAIKLTRVGKPYNYSELPDPPGYPPIPATRPVTQTSLPPSLPKPTQSLPPQKTMGSKFMPTPSVSHDQLVVLTQRQKELLTAVKEAKAKGNKETAIHYLKQYKGMEKMIEAATNGLPVDLTQVPPSPYADVSKTKPSTAVLSHLKPAAEGDDETFDRIKKQLQVQIDLCTTNAKTYEDLKNVGTATQYQNMSRELQKELLAIEGIQSQGLCPPKFTMETRKFSIVHTNTDLSAQQCEVEVVKATAIPRPEGYEEKDLTLYVEVEFPWPSDAAPKACTDSVKATSSPEFNHKEKFDIERKHTRSILRILKRSPLRCTLWQKRTLRKHLFIGQAVLPLDKLENHVEVRATLDLLDEKGRKPVGGKMEVVARLREPFTGRDMEEKEEQWLVFQESIAVTSSVQMPRPSPTSSLTSSGPNLAHLSPMKVDRTTSIEALKVELSLVQNALKSGHKDAATVQKGRQIQAHLQVIHQRLQSDPQFRAGYPRQVAKEIQLEQTLEGKLVQAGKNREAKIIQMRRQAMQQELKTFSSKK